MNKEPGLLFGQLKTICDKLKKKIILGTQTCRANQETTEKSHMENSLLKVLAPFARNRNALLAMGDRCTFVQKVSHVLVKKP